MPFRIMFKANDRDGIGKYIVTMQLEHVPRVGDTIRLMLHGPEYIRDTYPDTLYCWDSEVTRVWSVLNDQELEKMHFEITLTPIDEEATELYRWFDCYPERAKLMEKKDKRR